MELDRSETIDDEHTKLVFTGRLEHSYVRESVIIYGNVALATQGESKTEILGSGNGSIPFQEFTLKQTPLTYISAATVSGSSSTLEVRVSNVLWTEVETLFKRGWEEKVYTTRLADDGKVTVQFGDGITGARLPTGVENIVAKYRVGSGLAGLVDAEQITLLMTRPFGVKGVENPMAPSGADDPEELDNARNNAPLTVLTLDRIVSLQDYEAFASAFAGIGKAQAAVVWNGERRIVHITIAGVDGASVDDELYYNLRTAIDAARHPDQLVKIHSYTSKVFGIDAKVLVDTSCLTGDVLDAVKSTLVTSFSFDKREFGQPVSASQVLSVMQKVEGVIAVDLDSMNDADPFLQPNVLASGARWNKQRGETEPAQLLTINADDITLSEKAP